MRGRGSHPIVGCARRVLARGRACLRSPDGNANDPGPEGAGFCALTRRPQTLSKSPQTHGNRQIPQWFPCACRCSTAVVQRFCKPKVGSSILSTGTSPDNRLAPFLTRQLPSDLCRGGSSLMSCRLQRPAPDARAAFLRGNKSVMAMTLTMIHKPPCRQRDGSQTFDARPRTCSPKADERAWI